MLEAVGGGVGARASGAGDLEKGVGALKRFQAKVDALLSELENSAAGSTKVAQQRVSRAALSGSNLPFVEADGFFKQYNRVHEALVNLSRSLGDQLEMLQIAVRASEVGYDNLEEELRQRFYAIQTRVEAERERAEASKPKDNSSVNDGKSVGTTDLG
ncbi:hypothetical protein [Streptomyces indicus]|uniref:Uncharacterized protein n=1 Tax=Streptomyces indicus TaxID=417292 RepID=A0A1G8VSX7_9ACTN|nr:hypothetical protein [Streptomyces indicus]SDJ69181.1 hypothetical protein SAMN05421806_10221 [Streptomyces indicus]